MYAGEDGQSHFEDVDVDVGETGTSEMLDVSGMIFRLPGGNYNHDWHNAPRKQFIVVLGGTLEIEVPEGVRRFGPGSLVLAEDLTGKGHLTRFDSASFVLLPVPE